MLVESADAQKYLNTNYLNDTNVLFLKRSQATDELHEYFSQAGMPAYQLGCPRTRGLSAVYQFHSEGVGDVCQNMVVYQSFVRMPMA